jgi:hypothetical protein
MRDNDVNSFQACMAVENGYFESLNDMLAEKYNMSQQVPEVCSMFLYG